MHLQRFGEILIKFGISEHTEKVKNVQYPIELEGEIVSVFSSFFYVMSCEIIKTATMR